MFKSRQDGPRANRGRHAHQVPLTPRRVLPCFSRIPCRPHLRHPPGIYIQREVEKELGKQENPESTKQVSKETRVVKWKGRDLVVRGRVG